MAEYDVPIPADFLSSFLTYPRGLAKLVETVLNQILDAQATEQVGAGRYERSDGRMAYRNGYRSRQLYTRVGHLRGCKKDCVNGHPRVDRPLTL